MTSRCSEFGRLEVRPSELPVAVFVPLHNFRKVQRARVFCADFQAKSQVVTGRGQKKRNASDVHLLKSHLVLLVVRISCDDVLRCCAPGTSVDIRNIRGPESKKLCRCQLLLRDGAQAQRCTPHNNKQNWLVCWLGVYAHMKVIPRMTTTEEST